MEQITISEKIKKTWEAINYPEGFDKDYDQRCKNSFSKLVDHIIEFCYFIFCIIALISTYFLITRELL